MSRLGERLDDRRERLGKRLGVAPPGEVSLGRPDRRHHVVMEKRDPRLVVAEPSCLRCMIHS